MAEVLIPFTKRIEFETKDWVMTYRARDQYGRDFFCYIRCDIDGYTKMQTDWLNKKTAEPSSYGTVIYTDYLKDPDDKAKKFLESWNG